MSNYGSPHRKNSATLIIVTNAKKGYVKSIQKRTMACRNCGYEFLDGEKAIPKWNGTRTDYYCPECAKNLAIYEETSPRPERITFSFSMEPRL